MPRNARGQAGAEVDTTSPRSVRSHRPAALGLPCEDLQCYFFFFFIFWRQVDLVQPVFVLEFELNQLISKYFYIVPVYCTAVRQIAGMTVISVSKYICFLCLRRGLPQCLAEVM